MVVEDAFMAAGAVVVLVDSVLVIFGTLFVIVEFVEVLGAALDFFLALVVIVVEQLWWLFKKF